MLCVWFEACHFYFGLLHGCRFAVELQLRLALSSSTLSNVDQRSLFNVRAARKCSIARMSEVD